MDHNLVTGILIGGVVGFFVGVFTTMFIHSFTVSTLTKGAQEAREEQEQNDPANWWKYGRDPNESD